MLRAKKTLTRIQAAVDAWATMAAEETFLGRTLGQFRVEVQAVYDLRNERTELDRRRAGNAAMCRDADDAALRLVRNIAAAVKLHPKYGEDSPLYAAMGYVRQSERRVGGRRRKRSAPVTDVKAEEPKS